MSTTDTPADVLAATGRWRFPQIDERRNHVVAPDGTVVCWVPQATATLISGAYNAQLRANRAQANRWLEGVLYGIHVSLAFGNQLPRIGMATERGVVKFWMEDDGDEEG